MSFVRAFFAAASFAAVATIVAPSADARPIRREIFGNWAVDQEVEGGVTQSIRAYTSRGSNSWLILRYEPGSYEPTIVLRTNAQDWYEAEGYRNRGHRISVAFVTERNTHTFQRVALAENGLNDFNLNDEMLAKMQALEEIRRDQNIQFYIFAEGREGRVTLGRYDFSLKGSMRAVTRAEQLATGDDGAVIAPR